MNTQLGNFYFSTISIWKSKDPSWNELRRSFSRQLSYGLIVATDIPNLPISFSEDRAWVYPTGYRFGNRRLRQSTTIAFEISVDSVIATLIYSGVTESGENEGEALENLSWFINNLLDEQEKNPDQPLGKHLAKQIKILQNTFERVPANH